MSDNRQQSGVVFFPQCANTPSQCFPAPRHFCQKKKEMWTQGPSVSSIHCRLNFRWSGSCVFSRVSTALVCSDSVAFYRAKNRESHHHHHNIWRKHTHPRSVECGSVNSPNLFKGAWHGIMSAIFFCATPRIGCCRRGSDSRISRRGGDKRRRRMLSGARAWKELLSASLPPSAAS